MKRIFLVVFTTLIFISCGSTMKVLSGFKNPKVESKETVLNYFNENKLGDETYFLNVNQLGDTLMIYRNLFLGMGSELKIFSSSKQRYCYNGTEECSGVQLKEAFGDFKNKYQPCIDDEDFMYKELLDNIQDRDGKPLSFDSLPKADFYIFAFWNKYLGSVKDIKENIDWIYELQEKSDLKTELILVNSDLLDEWGLEEGEELSTKFKKTKNGMSIDFGELPLSKN